MESRISRRTLLNAAGAAAAAGAAQAGTGPGEGLRGALIGCGSMGRGNMAGFMRLGARVTAVCDVDQNHLQQAAAQVKETQGEAPAEFTDFRRMLERADIDVVIIATPDHWHALPFIHACETGRHVYLEKPVSHNIEEGRAMVAAARKFGTICQVGAWQRSNPDFVNAVRYIRSGRLGRVTMVKAWKTDWFSMGRNNPQPPPPGLDWDFYLGPAARVPYTGKNAHFNWRWYFNTAGGNTGDWGVHMIDIGMLAMNPTDDLVMPSEVVCSGGKLSSGEEDDRTTPDTQIAVYKFPGYVLHWETGRRGQEYAYRKVPPAGDGGPARPPQDILDNGVCFITPEGRSLVVWRGGWMVRDTQGNEIQKDLPEEPPPAAHMVDWFECIRSKRQPRSSIYSMNQTTTVCHLANIAYLTGETVRWDSERSDLRGGRGKETLPYAREYRRPWELPVHRPRD